MPLALITSSAAGSAKKRSKALAAATWAIRFYERHGFRLAANDEKAVLLRKYWSVPERQIEASVVLRKL